MSLPDKIDILDKVFSQFIRLTYAFDNGFIECFTCSRQFRYNVMQNGHYVRRGHMALRFDIKNCFPQCYECNVTKDGNEEEYRKRLLSTFGRVHVAYLDEAKHEVKQWEEYELDMLIGYYRKRVRELSKEKGVRV